MPAQLSELAIDAAGVRLGVSAPGSAPELVQARLVVAADGAHSQVRAAAGIGAAVEDYAQVALVANVATDQPHADRAFERFTPSGPLAVLPLPTGGCAVIWACTPERAAAPARPRGRRLPGRSCRAPSAGAPDASRARGVAAPIRCSSRGPRPPWRTRTVLIGNAAQALHPVAGQGFNLGLRDAAMLAEVLAQAPAEAGAAEQLQRFAAWRAQDRARRGALHRFAGEAVRR